MAVFDNIRYWLSDSIPQERKDALTSYLTNNGAEGADGVGDATHIVTNTPQFEGWKRVEENEIDVHVTTEEWVTRSMVLGKAQPEQYYSADPHKVFSGVVACAADMSTADLEVISAGITGLGGQFRHGLTRDVTHLFALTSSSDKYTTALHFQHETHMKILLPHWFDDVVTLGIGGLPTEGYEWPDPELLRDSPPEVGADGVKKDKGLGIGPDKKRLFESVNWKDIPPPLHPPTNVWDGKKILLSTSLELVDRRREAVEAGITRSGGIVVPYKRRGGNGDLEEEGEKVLECDILITRWRHGSVYLSAIQDRKTVGTLAWLYHVESTGVFTPPTDQLLHYPILKKPIQGFSSHKITITNYTGPSREYLKKLITTLGAEFTPNMSGSNTVVIAAYIGGMKTTKAANWSIPIVNHVWLEDCWVQWRGLSVGLEKYIHFPPGMDFSKILGERGGVGSRGVELDLEKEDELLREDVDTRDLIAVRGGNGQKTFAQVWQEGMATEVKAPVGTGTSAKDAKEVEEAVGMFDDADVGMDVDVDMDVSPSKDLDKKAKAKKRERAKEPSDEEVSPSKSPEKKKKKTVTKTKKTKVVSDEDEDVEVVEEKTTKPKLIRRAKATTPDEPGSSRLDDKNLRDESSESEDLDFFPKAKDSSSKSKLQKKKIPLPASTHDTSEDDEPPVPTKGKGKAVAVETPSRTPKRVVSVVIDVDSAARKKHGLPRTESLRVQADEASISSSPKRGRPTKGGESQSTTRKDRDEASSSYTTPPKRSAAVKAASALHDVMMPDLMNYAQEKKRGFKGKDIDRVGSTEKSNGKSKKRPSDATEGLSGDEEAERKKKRRLSSGGKKKKPISDEDDESEAENRANKVTKKSRAKPVVADNSGDESSSAEGAKATTSRASKTNPKAIRLMTTQVSLPEPTVKALTKLGVKLTTRANECTHLLVPQLVRTEKFLCAMAVAPFILKEDWALDSASSKRILPEDDYLLHDENNEKKYHFKLADALRRARTVGWKLFDKKVFYVTPKVPVDIKILKNVVTAGGGQVLTTTPTNRILNGNDNRHIVSCPEDVSIWRPLSEMGFPVYTPEFLLTGALRQELDWEDTANQVPGSY